MSSLEAEISTAPFPSIAIKENKYDLGIVGGGLAGLSLAIQMARLGYSIIIFEKEKYPFHKVCGEYISLESWDFLNNLGIDLVELKVPIIRKLQLSALNGKLINQSLPLGGFGISRYLLDSTLAKLARQAGVTIEENVRVNEVLFNDPGYTIYGNNQSYQVRAACSCYGKRSNLDIKWKRPFTRDLKSKLNNYIGIKYHIRTQFPEDTIALHTFKQGYCGLVKIEGEKYNLCYLTTAANLNECSNSIDRLEKKILYQNPHLQKIFSESERTEDEVQTISLVSFDKKSQVEEHILMLGDAAGMITPLCGNGMSMALHASKLAAIQLDYFLQGRIGQKELEDQYQLQWQKQFGERLRMGRREIILSKKSAVSSH